MVKLIRKLSGNPTYYISSMKTPDDLRASDKFSV